MILGLAAPIGMTKGGLLNSARSRFYGSSLRMPVKPARPVCAFVGGPRAMFREWPDPDYIAEVIESFPDKGIANAEEARILFTEAGYKYLDVRPEIELEATGKIKGNINVPFVNARWKYDPEQKKKVVEKEPNEKFVEQVKKRIPDLEAHIIVADSDGRTYAIDALEALDEAGYVNMVGLKGGFYAWYRVWDNNLRRRRNGEYQENYSAADGDSCGIHASGAGFERVDAIESWVPPKF